jgi:hypothetical protein
VIGGILSPARMVTEMRIRAGMPALGALVHERPPSLAHASVQRKEIKRLQTFAARRFYERLRR